MFQKKDDKYGLAYASRGRCYANMQQFEMAISDLRKGFQLMPSSYADFYHNKFYLFFSLVSVGKFDEAVGGRNY